MARETSAAQKRVLLTSELRPDPHPLATVLHDANNKLQILMGGLVERASEFEELENAVLTIVVDEVRDKVQALLKAAGTGDIDAQTTQSDLMHLHGRLRAILPPLQDVEGKRYCVSRDSLECSIDEFDMLMERGLQFLQNQPPEDQPSLGDLSEHVSKIVSDYEHRYPQVSFHLDKSAGCETYFHPPSIKRFIENLFNNSIQSFPEEGGEIIVRVENKIYDAEGRPDAEIKEGSYVRIQITDNGSGISEDVLFKLQHSTVTTKEDGSGLGLVSARKSMIRHRGHLIIESEEGDGTKVTALIPSSHPPPKAPSESSDDED